MDEIRLPLPEPVRLNAATIMAIDMLKIVARHRGREAAIGVAREMILAAAAIICRESGEEHARRILELAAEALMEGAL
jgi:hypothetical protein